MFQSYKMITLLFVVGLIALSLLLYFNSSYSQRVTAHESSNPTIGYYTHPENFDPVNRAIAKCDVRQLEVLFKEPGVNIPAHPHWRLGHEPLPSVLGKTKKGTSDNNLICANEPDNVKMSDSDKATRWVECSLYPLCGPVLKFLSQSGATLPKDYIFDAVKNNQVDAVGYLLSMGYSINAVQEGKPLLEFAIEGSDLPIVQFLVSQGADVNKAEEATGNTPLMSACHHHRTDSLKILLEAGADVMVKDKFGKTVMDYAYEQKNSEPELTNLLLSYQGQKPK